MLKFTRDNTRDIPSYVAEFVTIETPVARIEQRDNWELPKRVRWSLDLNGGAKLKGQTLYYDSLRDAKDGLAQLLAGALRYVVVNAGLPYPTLKRMGKAD